ncbi:CopG family ribbon-helix-helix protein [Methylolobus aquaticus]
MKATTVRLADETLDRVDQLADAMHRSRTWVIKEAVDRYLDHEEWFVQQVTSAIKSVDAGHIATADEVAERFKRWGVDAG